MRNRIVLVGTPTLSGEALAILIQKFGKTKGIEVFKRALMLQVLGWYGMRRLLDRATVLRLRRDLLAAGLLEGAYEEEVGYDEMLSATI